MTDPKLPVGLLDALSAPMGDLICSIGLGVAQAQRQMDAATLETLREIATSDHEMIALMRSIGYRPTWYQIPEAEAEIAIALSVSGAEERGGRPTVYAAPVDATYANKFNWDLQASSKLKFRVVPVPPPLLAENLVVVPELVGRTLAEARSIAAAAGASLEVNAGAAEDDVVGAQSPATGSFSVSGAVLVTTEPRQAAARPRAAPRASSTVFRVAEEEAPQQNVAKLTLRAIQERADEPEE